MFLNARIMIPCLGVYLLTQKTKPHLSNEMRNRVSGYIGDARPFLQVSSRIDLSINSIVYRGFRHMSKNKCWNLSGAKPEMIPFDIGQV